MTTRRRYPTHNEAVEAVNRQTAEFNRKHNATGTPARARPIARDPSRTLPPPRPAPTPDPTPRGRGARDREVRRPGGTVDEIVDKASGAKPRNMAGGGAVKGKSCGKKK